MGVFHGLTSVKLIQHFMRTFPSCASIDCSIEVLVLRLLQISCLMSLRQKLVRGIVFSRRNMDNRLLFEDHLTLGLSLMSFETNYKEVSNVYDQEPFSRIDSLREMSSPGKSESIFYLTQDDRFIIKTVKKSEVKLWS